MAEFNELLESKKIKMLKVGAASAKKKSEEILLTAVSCAEKLQ